MNKDTAGKPKLDLVPYEALVQIAKVREFGSSKYKDDWAWLYDDTVSPKAFLVAALRHIYKALHVEELDPESGLKHTAHAAASLAMALAKEGFKPQELLDFPMEPDEYAKENWEEFLPESQ